MKKGLIKTLNILLILVLTYIVKTFLLSFHDCSGDGCIYCLLGTIFELLICFSLPFFFIYSVALLLYYSFIINIKKISLVNIKKLKLIKFVFNFINYETLIKNHVMLLE